MKHRDRVIKALNRETTDRPPFQATFTPEFARRLRRNLGLKDSANHDPHCGRWNGYELEIATGQDAFQCGIGWFTNYYLNTQPYTDEWGVNWRTDPYNTPFGEGVYTNLTEGPLKEDSAVDSYRAPDPGRPELYTNLERLIRYYKDEYYIIGRLHCTVFESAWALRGFEQLMMDFYLNPDLAQRILELTFNYHLIVARNMALKGVDMIWLGDDLGGQEGLLIPPEIWREFLKPLMKSIIDEIRNINPVIKIAYHTDGNNYDVIPELIEIGIDVLNPVQPECMDPVLLKEKYGNELCFFGAIPVQSTLPLGTPQQIHKEVDHLKNTLGKNGGWICAPTHHLQLDTPMENFRALLDALAIHHHIN
ncbi:MAG TPA: uroporphyrinogen decarboxylase family protein [Bacteroidales bacterium]|nr:uroporphyrinogen decarboxylase family protein [Bacteroidales bacterium]